MMNMRLHVRATRVCDYDEQQLRVKRSYVTTPAMTIKQNIRYMLRRYATDSHTYLVDLSLGHRSHLR